MRGGHKRVSIDELRKIVEIIELSGFELVTKHQIDKDTFNIQKKMTLRQIHDRDIEFIKEADIIVAEISNPSLGVGAEVADAVYMKKPVLCFYKEDLGSSISGYLRGKPGVECFEYSSLGELKARLFEFAERTKKKD